jgi:uncharacterized protein YkwD
LIGICRQQVVLTGNLVEKRDRVVTVYIDRKFMRLFMILSICLFAPTGGFAEDAGSGPKQAADVRINKAPPAATNKAREKQRLKKPAPSSAATAQKRGEDVQINRMLPAATNKAREKQGLKKPISNSTAAAPVNDEGVQIRRMLLAATNKAREKQGLNKLTQSAALVFLAQNQAQNMCKTGEFAHESKKLPKGWRMFVERMQKASLTSGAENLAYRTKSREPEIWVDSVIKGWMGSPGHKRNILNPKFKFVGIGSVECKDLIYTAQVFSDEPGRLPGNR